MTSEPQYPIVENAQLTRAMGAQWGAWLWQQEQAA